MHEIIAEIGTSHLGSLDEAKRMIDAARAAGADTVKFQWVLADEIVSSRAGRIPLPNGSANIYRYFKSVECHPDFYARVKEHAEAQGVRFLCSVFGAESLRLLMRMRPDRVKIASPEVNHLLLLRHIARQATDAGVEIIISGGVSSLIDLLRATDMLRGGGATNITVLRCVTQYPAAPSSYYIKLLPVYARLFSCACGVSDHTREAALVPAVAAAFGSTTTEKHFTLRGDAPVGKLHKTAPDDPIALPPDDFLNMARSVRRVAGVRKSDGYDSAVAEVERMFGTAAVQSVIGTGAHGTGPVHEGEPLSAVLLPHYRTTRRSVFARVAIAAGDPLNEKNCELLRSERNIAPGVPSEVWRVLMGKRAREDIAKGAPVRLQDIAM